MTTTVGQLIDQISSHLHDFTGAVEATTYLTAYVNPSALAFPVQHPSKIRQGYIEIDDELIHIDTVGSTSATAMPFGRGVNGSVAVEHLLNAKVVNDPQFPRVRIFDAVKRAILQVQPDLFAITPYTFTSSPVLTTYDVPVDVDRILQVSYQTNNNSGEWIKINHWTFDPAGSGATGKTITIHSAVPSARTMQVVYAGPYTSPVATTDVLETTCKIPASVHDVLLWNVISQLVPFAELVRMNLRSVEQQARAQGVNVGDPSKVAERMYVMYQRRLLEERKRLLLLYPPVKHNVR